MDSQNIRKCINHCQSCVTKPCQVGCPLHNDITSFIKYMKEDNYLDAYKTLCKTTYLPAVCGRICPYARQCQGSCVMGVSYEPVQIGYLESVVADIAIKNKWNFYKKGKKVGKSVAVIGGGPASLSCAARLRELGVNVTIFEKHNYLGGILRHGIPEFRLPRESIDEMIDRILSLNIDIKYNQELGKNLKLDDIVKEYDAVFIGIGANISNKMNIPGEDLDGLYGANELLESGKHPSYESKTVVISGGGNVAMDMARICKRLGAKVYVVYRRSESQMPAEDKEVSDAKSDGVEFVFQNSIVKIHGKNRVEKIECVKNELKEVDGQPATLQEVEGSNYFINCDYVIMAVGSHVEGIVNNLELSLDRHNKIDVDEFQRTSNEKVFAGGDVCGNIATVAWASHSGIVAAQNIYEYLTK